MFSDDWRDTYPMNKLVGAAPNPNPETMMDMLARMYGKTGLQDTDLAMPPYLARLRDLMFAHAATGMAGQGRDRQVGPFEYPEQQSGLPKTQETPFSVTYGTRFDR